MKKTIYMAASMTALMAMATTSSVLADDTDASTPSVATSHGKIAFTPKDTPTNPVDPMDPSQPGKEDPTDPGNGGTGNNGPLSLDYVSNIDFGSHEVNTGVFNALNETPYVQVTDSREVGNWALTASMTKAFTNEKTQAPLSGAVMTWSNGEVISNNGNTSAKPVLGSQFELKNGSQDVKVMNTNDTKGFAGKGTWVDRFRGTQGNNENVTLSVPSVPNAGTYSAEITWSLADVPVV
ncbi:hypothetical protein RD055328_12250 [Companilactobacillus sp. RD055328]|uniref:WxL domain-containing protein n=1 Tax=Companilactobacillus sp. RD055328 TaxID=2916634 RepID=UPI001FC84E9B|nr:WxL domain-containing protein [Companilactobacillus sp. RD055328]GKQ43302.1 hypothetical protein RD055328_12250 [Companilactobacillus sp. RD055328]